MSKAPVEPSVDEIRGPPAAWGIILILLVEGPMLTTSLEAMSIAVSVASSLIPVEEKPVKEGSAKGALASKVV